MSRVAQYRKARTEYAIATLKRDIAALAKNVERQVNSAKNKSDLDDAIYQISILEDADRFCKEIGGKKWRLPKTSDIFNFKLGV